MHACLLCVGDAVRSHDRVSWCHRWCRSRAVWPPLVQRFGTGAGCKQERDRLACWDGSLSRLCSVCLFWLSVFEDLFECCLTAAFCFYGVLALISSHDVTCSVTTQAVSDADQRLFKLMSVFHGWRDLRWWTPVLCIAVSVWRVGEELDVIVWVDVLRKERSSLECRWIEPVLLDESRRDRRVSV